MIDTSDTSLHLVARSSIRWNESSPIVEHDEAFDSSGLETLSSPGDGIVRIGHLSDIHVGKPVDAGPAAPAALKHWLTAFDDVGVDVVIVSGDLVESPGDRVGLLRVRHLLETHDLPWVAVPGNHDVAHPGRPGVFGELIGGYPRIERHDGVDFVLFDSMGGLPVDAREPYERLVGERVCYMRGRVGEEQLSWASARLGGAKNRPRVLVVHHHLVPQEEVLDGEYPSGAPERLMVPLLDADRLLEWADRHAISLAFHGHRHRHWPLYLRRGLVISNAGSAARGKPERRARIVDLERRGMHAHVLELAMLPPDLDVSNAFRDTS